MQEQKDGPLAHSLDVPLDAAGGDKSAGLAVRPVAPLDIPLETIRHIVPSQSEKPLHVPPNKVASGQRTSPCHPPAYQRALATWTARLNA